MQTHIKTKLAAIGGAGLALALLLGAAPASALTAKECSDKYNAAKAAGTLGGKSWNQFRKTDCAAGASAAPAAAPAAPAAEAKKEAPKASAPAASPPPSAAAGSGPTYPTAIAPAYAKEKPAKARMHTCLDQYKANKAAGTLGGMKWIQKAGGYYSECNKRLKGGA